MVGDTVLEGDLVFLTMPLHLFYDIFTTSRG